MKLAACVVVVLAIASVSVRSQRLANLGLEDAQLPALEHGFPLSWNQGAPGSSHNPSADDYVGYPVVNAGFSVSFAWRPRRADR